MTLTSRHLKIIKAKNWQHARRLLEKYSMGWVFRGQGNFRWNLETSLERALSGWRDKLQKVLVSDSQRLAKVFDGMFDGEPMPQAVLDSLVNAAPVLFPPTMYNPLKDMEQDALRLFQSRLHHYLPNNALPRNVLEWLALMQHHGTPTRLLDFTSSPYVAAFFALENPAEACSVWGLHVGWFEDRGKELVQRSLMSEEASGEGASTKIGFLEYIMSRDLPGVFPLRPSQLNERLVAQQGLFFALGDTTKDFTENLMASGDRLRDYSIRIDIPGEFSAEALTDLNRMNINRATLFPGIDGFAQSIKAHMQTQFDEHVTRNQLRTALEEPHLVAAAISPFLDQFMKANGTGFQEVLKVMLDAENVNPEEQTRILEALTDGRILGEIGAEMKSAFQRPRNKKRGKAETN